MNNPLSQSLSLSSYLISSCEAQLLRDYPMISALEGKRRLGYWTTEDSDLMYLDCSGNHNDIQGNILRNSIFMLLILESETYKESNGV